MENTLTHLNKKRYLILNGSRSIDNYEYLNKIDEGSYGIVFRAKDKVTGEIVAIKKIKLQTENEGFPITSIREINILLSIQNENIINISEIVVGNTTDKIYCVMEYMDYELKALLNDKTYIFNWSHIKCLFKQLLSGLDYIHDNWIVHRDLKTSNLLLNKNGTLKIADFGLARKYSDPLKNYTKLVVTLWYRAPELLLNCNKYGPSIDVWSCGCILAELILREPLFQGENELDQMNKIFKVLGTPNENTFPEWLQLPNTKIINFKVYEHNKLKDKFDEMKMEVSDLCLDLLNQMLLYNPNKRITAKQALKHKFFEELPLPCSQQEMPIFPETNDKQRQETKRNRKQSIDEHQRQQRQQISEGNNQ